MSPSYPALTEAGTEIRHAAIALLAQREHSRRELTEKLSRRFSDTDTIAAQIDWLQQENLQSDARFAEQFVRSRVQRGHGPYRIKSELRQRGVEGAVIDSALAQNEIDWDARLAELIERKWGDTPATDIKELAKRSRYLQGRGFDGDAIRKRLTLADPVRESE